MKFNKKNIILISVLVVSAILIIYASFILVRWENNNKKTLEQLDKVSKLFKVDSYSSDIDKSILVNPPDNKQDPYWSYVTKPFINIDFDELLKVNPETVAYIKVDGTNIDYPVVQHIDNNFYLSHSFDKSDNHAGWVFSDYRNNMLDLNNNTIFYGHSMRNKTIFGSLKNILTDEWYNAGNAVYLSTPTENTIWQVFSVCLVKKESYYITTNFNDEQEYGVFLDTIKSRSKYDFNTNINTKDKVLTLSTCNGSDSTKRVVLHARLIKKDIKNK